MKRKNIKEKILLYLFKCIIMFAFTGYMYFVWINYYNPYLPLSFYRLGNYLIAVVVLMIYLFFIHVYGGFMVGTASVSDLIFSQIISIGFLQGACYVIFSLLSYKLVSVVPFIVNFLLFSVFAVVWCYLANRFYFKLHKPKKTIVVYGNIDSYYSIKGIKQLKPRFKVVKEYNYENVSLEKIYKIMENMDAVFICGVPSDYRNELVKFCIANDKAVYIKPKISDTIIRGGKTMQMMNVCVYRCKRSDASLVYVIVKRAFDILLSLIAIIISSPIMAGTAIAIKLYDGGDAIYKQVRLTTNGKEFKIMKFRSMVQNAEKDGVARLATDNDDRITPVGKIIRKFRLDELPQLFNILKGDMSFVGPRPERPEIAKEYEKDIPEFALRLQAKAGLTGYAQVYGKYNTPPYDKVQMDLMYIANQSIIEDLKLMLMTFKIMFVPSSTEGVDENQTTATRISDADEE